VPPVATLPRPPELTKVLARLDSRDSIGVDQRCVDGSDGDYSNWAAWPQ
jgi:hypothetical protein